MIRRKCFSTVPTMGDVITNIEERAYCAGYEQRMFDEDEDEITVKDLMELQKENEKRAGRRKGGHIIGAAGTAGLVLHGLPHPILRHTPLKIPNALAIGTGAGLTAGGIYRINKKGNRELTPEEYLAMKKKGEI